MEGETSKLQYKLVEYDDTLYQIPIRNINQEYVVLLSDVQSILPNATGFLSNNTKLVPFQLDNQFNELIPKRVLISNNKYYDEDEIWTVVIPTSQEAISLTQANIELQIKMDQLSEKLDLILSSLPHLQQGTRGNGTQNRMATHPTTAVVAATAAATAAAVTEGSQEENILITNTEEARQLHYQEQPTERTQVENHRGGQGDNEEEEDQEERVESRARGIRSNSPPPAFTSNHVSGSSSSSAAAVASSSSPSIANRRQIQQQHEQAPPSYETSVLSTIKSINSKLCLYESHIFNRHKSPKWLAKRQEWLSREPNSIEEVAYQLVQLEMALLWTAVSESWIQERETWLTLVASARSERHLAGAIINLERHTLVMDDDWANIRDRWINELLEMVVLPLSHG